MHPDSACVEWPGYRDRDGYGRTEGWRLAHRVAYEAIVGPIPEGLTLDHLCRNRACVNPEHLEAVSRLVNVRRGREARTHCKNGHPWDEENTRMARGYRVCRACDRAAHRRQYERQTT